MNDALCRRFSCCFDFDYSRKAKIYAAVVYFDLRYRYGHSAVYITAVKEYLKKECPYSVSTANIIGSANIIEMSTTSSTDEQNICAPGDCSAAAILSAFFSSDYDAMQLTEEELPGSILAEIDMYDSYPRQPNAKKSLIDFWLEMQSNGYMPILSKVALDILFIPASSASVERLFNVTGRAKCIFRPSLDTSALTDVNASFV